MINRNSAGEPVSITIPIPRVRPLGIPVDTVSGVQEVWDAFIKPAQDRGDIQSVEERVLMAILRAVYQGIDEENILKLYTIYKNVSDYPDHKYVVREWLIQPGGQEPIAGDAWPVNTLEEARRVVPLGYTRTDRQEGDDATIKETWI